MATTRYSAVGSTTRRRRPSSRAQQGVNWRLVGGAAALLSLVVGVVAELAVLAPPPSGALGEPTRRLINQAVGWTAPLLPLWPIVLGLLGLYRSIRPQFAMPVGRLWGAALANLALIGLLHVLPIGASTGLARAQEGKGGGLVGYALGSGLSEALGPAAALALLSVGLILGLLLTFDIAVSRALGWCLWLLKMPIAALSAMRERRRQEMRINVPRVQQERALPGRLTKLVRRAPKPPEPLTMELGTIEQLLPAAVQQQEGPVNWRLPPLSVFDPSSTANLVEVDLRQRARTIEETLASFNIEARVVEVNQGPTVTQFGIEPAPGVAVRRILALQNDIGLRLGAWPVRFEAPVPGKRVVGLEVPNQSVALVPIRGLLESDDFAQVRSTLRLALGRDVSGRPVIADLARMPHLLIAGATGSGKSVCINEILASLMIQNTPDQLHLMMIDPKMVELMQFNGVPHLGMPVVTDMDRVVGALKWVVREMDRRYGLFVQRSTRNIESYNRSVEGDPEAKLLPYLVVVIDELADMMLSAPEEVELALCRLAQKSRATGIHLIVATQRPSVDVLTGLIKANFVTRIAFAVSAQVDSRVILDTVGAEKLLGRGDMLYSSGDASKPLRIQGAWVSDQELQRLVAHWKRQGLPRFTEVDVEEMIALGQSTDDDQDELYQRAVSVAGQYSRVSTSLLQRRLGIGYPRAARLIDLMEERGVLDSSQDGRPRPVLAQAETSDDE
jgi:S-DNA-T family DNA segregation ATPase FtsK/SpoIIIE